MVDGLAARLAAHTATAADVQELRGIIAAQREHTEQWRPDAYTRLNVEFHACILAIASNRYLDAQLPLVRLTSQVFLPAFSLTRGRAISAIEEHGEIVDAIERQDAVFAEQWSRKHIEKTLAQIAYIHPK